METILTKLKHLDNSVRDLLNNQARTKTKSVRQRHDDFVSLYTDSEEDESDQAFRFSSHDVESMKIRQTAFWSNKLDTPGQEDSLKV